MAILNNTENLIKYFNEKTGKRFKFGNAENSAIIEQCLSISNDLSKAYKFINEWIAQGNDLMSNNCLINCFRDYAVYLTEEKSAVQESPVQNTSPEAALGAMDLLSKVVTELIAKTNIEQCGKAVEENLESHVDEYMMKKYGPIPKKVVIEFPQNPDYKVPENEVVHDRFIDILTCIQLGLAVYLVGPAGSGKNYICKQIADTLSLEFYYQSQVMQPYEITGYSDAMGIYHESTFYKAFTKGGIFMIDEMDASCPEALIILNAALANGYFNFPAPIGNVSAHPNFRCVAAGNTAGFGADAQYVGRNQLDAASLDRFAMIKMDYCEAIEESICQDKELLSFLRDFRKFADKNGILAIVSYRAMKNMYTLTKSSTPDKIVEMCLTKGLAKDDIKHIMDCYEYTNKWTSALKTAYKNAA